MFSTLALLAFCGFCGFGFLASFEPLPPLQRWMGLVAYPILGAVSLLTVVWVWWPRRTG
jgi:hypothetical protein